MSTADRARAAAAALAALTALAACGGGGQPGAVRGPAPAAAAPLPANFDDPTDTSCAVARRSFAPLPPTPPPGAMPAGSFMARIQQRGYLVAGVPRGTLGFGAVDPATARPEGFDVDMVRQVSRAIFGDEDHVEYRFVSTAERIPLLAAGQLDLVVSTFTITCGRWAEVAFSQDYYDDWERLMVPRASPIRGAQDLAGRTVCATTGSTSSFFLRHRPPAPRIRPVAVSDFNDCLVLLQQGQVDAILTNEGILAGLHQEDAYTEIVGQRFVDEQHGMAVSLCHTDFVRFLDGVLERMRADGTWARLYGRWLAPALGPQAQPPPDLGDRSPDGRPPYPCPS